MVRVEFALKYLRLVLDSLLTSLAVILIKGEFFNEVGDGVPMGRTQTHRILHLGDWSLGIFSSR